MVVGQVTTAGSEKPTKRPFNLILRLRHLGTARNVVALTLLAAFLGSYIAMILVWEDFAYYDDDLFTLVTLKGHDIWLFIWRNTGRFWPLADQEFNLIRHLTNTAVGYHMVPIAQLLILSFILIILDDELSITARAALAILALITPTILISYSGLTIAERNVVFLLACVVLFVVRFERSQSTAWAVAAAVCAQLMLYYKETVFLLLFGFAAGRLILRCRNAHHLRWDYDRLLDKESCLDLCLASLAAFFLVYYFAVMGIHGNMSYAVQQRQQLVEMLLAELRLDLLAWIFVFFVLGRIYLILRRGAAPLLLWDGLAFGGLAYFLAYLGLRMFSTYYLAPVDFIAVLYIGRFAVLSWKEMRSWSRVTALMLAFAVVLQDVSLSTLAVFERKNFIHAKVEIASVLETRYRSGTGNGFRLFFPFANPYVIMEFAAYLDYRGVGLDSIVLATRAIDKDAPCVGWGVGWGYMTISCHALSEPAPGDLVIVLPDDVASRAEASMYRKRGEQIFSYEPRPPIPHLFYSLAGGLPVAAAKSINKTRPDRWMDASVTVWK